MPETISTREASQILRDIGIDEVCLIHRSIKERDKVIIDIILINDIELQLPPNTKVLVKQASVTFIFKRNSTTFEITIFNILVE